MNKLTVSCLLFLALTAIAVFAADRGTPDEAKAMLQKAIAHYKSVGRKQALADFNAKKPPFGDRDLYVVCIASDHTIVANGGFPQYVSMSADLMKDANGKSIGQAGYDLASSKGEGELHYRWINPATKKMENKVSYFARAGDDACAVGAYSPN
jgi:hypothetical protein